MHNGVSCCLARPLQSQWFAAAAAGAAAGAACVACCYCSARNDKPQLLLYAAYDYLVRCWFQAATTGRAQLLAQGVHAAPATVQLLPGSLRGCQLPYEDQNAG